MLAHRLEQRERPDQVGVDERGGRVAEGIVVVGFRREVHDQVAVGDEPIHERGIGDVTLHERDPIGDRVQGRSVAA